MLKALYNWTGYHRQAAKESMQDVYQHPIASMTTLLVLAITLTFPSLFWVAYDNAKTVSAQWKPQKQLHVYFQPALKEAEVNTLHMDIHNLPRVASSDFISAQEGLARLKKQKDIAPILNDLEDNPLPAATIVYPKVKHQTTGEMLSLQVELENMNGVDQVVNDSAWLLKLHAILTFFKRIVYVIVALLSIAVILIIANTLRLSMQNKYEQISVLKLIGASDAYILRPFIYLGIFYGLGAGCIALLITASCLHFIGLGLNPILSQYTLQWSIHFLSLKEILIILASSTLLGWLAARVSAQNTLRQFDANLLRNP